MKTLYLTDGRVRLYREETYFGRTTPRVEWHVTTEPPGEKEWVVRTCATRKEALEWVATYTKPTTQE